jgi:hypothetical protein
MNKYHKFLFYYSLVVSTILFISSIFLAPTPQNFFLLVLFMPITFYFWLKVITSKEKSKKTEESTLNWSLKMAGVVFLLGMLGVFAFFLAGKADPISHNLSAMTKIYLTSIGELRTDVEQLASQSPESEQLLSEVEDIKDDIEALRDEQAASRATLGFSSDDSYSYSDLGDPMGSITITDSKWSVIDVFQDTISSSKIIGQIEYGETYSFFESRGSWYRIELPSGQDGWVSANFVKETGGI